jgi:molybdate-binding protein
VHVAGLHVGDEGGEGNVAAVRALAGVGPITLVTLARWQEGLVMRGEHARRVRGVTDLTQRGLRLVAREPGAGAQRLLERKLKEAGVGVRVARAAALVAPGHLEVAGAVALGAADVGVATRDAALAWGLHFTPLADERYDLALPSALLDDARVGRLLDALTSVAMRRELSALGYDTTHAGRIVAEVSS